MFNKIRHRLLLSYLLVLASILGGFAIAVRLVFTHSLYSSEAQKLTALAEISAANTEFDNGRIKIENDFPPEKLVKNHQSLRWFDKQGKLLQQQGSSLNAPFDVQDKYRTITIGKNQIQSVTLPIIRGEDKQLIGYLQASQYDEELNETLNKLDWGLGGGIFLALIFSSVGGIWLTRQAMQPIEDSFQRLKQFTADASHELRSPLMAIKTNAAVALKYSEGMRETDLEKFQVITSATNQMTRLTDDLLFLARNDKVPNPSFNIINLTELLNQLMQMYKPQAETKQISLTSQLDKSLHVAGDSTQLTRLFSNLIDNALHYTPSKGKVEINTNCLGSHIYIKIQDTGIGIAPENLQNIFERFWRADKSRSYNYGGSGLGLAIAQTIAQNHGGIITVTSLVEVGSCFTVKLPLPL